MSVLVIPAAGLSSRYGLERPKFLLQHPRGKTMLTQGLMGLLPLDKLGITKVIVISLKDFFENLSIEKFEAELRNTLKVDAELVLLENPTSSAIETLIKYLEHSTTDESFIIKDADNYIRLPESFSGIEENFISFVDLMQFPQVTAHNKSFVSFDTNQNLDNIVEKRIQGSLVNVGLIKFNKISDFLAATKELGSIGAGYVSDIVRILIDHGTSFRGIPAQEYDDWGTLEDWRKYCANYKTFFVDIDGCLVINQNPLSNKGGWGTFPEIQTNFNWLKKIAKTGTHKIIFTTSRSKEFSPDICDWLKSAGFTDFELITDLPHGQRILINDFAGTNPFPSAVAVNLPRNNNDLSSYFE